jgi:hypothetical protein
MFHRYRYAVISPCCCVQSAFIAFLINAAPDLGVPVPQSAADDVSAVPVPRPEEAGIERLLSEAADRHSAGVLRGCFASRVLI